MTAQSRWDALNTARSAVLNRAWRASDVTIPGLLPRPGHNDTTSLPTPYQSLGARGVNNLASKLLLAQFPSGTSFFRLDVAPKLAEQLAANKQLQDIQARLATIEQRVTAKIEASNYRMMIFETLRHLIVAGNGLLYMPKEGGLKLYRLDQFVCVRDGMGHILEVVVKECLAPAALDEAVRTLVKIEPDSTEDVDLYTHITWKSGQASYYQEIKGIQIPDSQGRHKAEESPWIPLRWQAVANENYGRSLVMEYIGDMLSLESLSQSITEFAEAASRILFLLHANSSTDADDLATANSGDVITGNKTDIDVLQLEKFQDFTVAKNVTDKLEQRLAYAFLLQSGTIRDAERVTAEEIRALAQELEDVLGGVYSVLSQELQLPVVRRQLALMQQTGELPDLPKGSVTPIITTGFAALGRNHSVNKLRAWLSDANNLLGQQFVAQWVESDKVLNALGTGYGVEALAELIKSPQQVQQEQQQAMQAQAAMTAVPHVAGALAKNASQPTGDSNDQ